MLTLITGGTGTGKTAHLVDLLEKEILTGRVIFTNISGLKLPHYRIGKMSEWQKGTWLHIDRYKRLSSEFEMEEENLDALANWEPHPDIVKDDQTGLSFRVVYDSQGVELRRVPYESHKGALIVIDEAQNHFRPRSQGSAVPDSVAAFEVHRHMGLDFWLCTQRPLQLDANVRGLCLKHIALRSTWQGRHSYEWPQVSDIDSKSDRDLAAKKSYRLPKHVFGLYRSADHHTEVKHALPVAAKLAIVLIPLFFIMAFVVFKMVQSKVHPAADPAAIAQAAKFDMPAQFFESAAPASSVSKSSTGELLDMIPAVQNHPETAPLYASLRQPVNLPWPDACIRSNTSCKCYSKHGEFLPDIGLERCIEVVNATPFNPYVDRRNEVAQAQPVPQRVAQVEQTSNSVAQSAPLVIASRSAGSSASPSLSAGSGSVYRSAP